MQLASCIQSFPESEHLGPRSDAETPVVAPFEPSATQSITRPVTNWTRFSPPLLSAHLHLGALCPPSASSNERLETDESPVLSFLVVLILFTGLIAVPPALGDDRPGVVKGAVEAVESGRALPGANVAVRQPSDSTLVVGATTDSTGHFTIDDVPTGTYIVVASFMGYEPASRKVSLTASNPTQTLTPFQLSPSTGRMRGATVSAERPLVTTKGSKKIYNFEKSQIALAGKSAVDVLQNLPSLRIDELDGAIQLRGNQSVSIHINGKPVTMEGTALVQYLKGLSAANVKRVEINTNPSARYDAEGTAGIINIVLDRKEEDGLSGGISASAGIGPRVDGSGNLGYKQGAWTLYGSYGYSRHEHEFVRDLLRRSADEASTLLLDQFSERQHEHGGHNFNVEVDYALTPKTTLSLTSTGSVRAGDASLNMRTYRGNADAPSIREVEEDNQSVHLDERLSFSHTFDDENHEMSADLRYQKGDQQDRVREEQVPTPSRDREMQADDEHDASFTLDYTRPLSDWTLETGYKGSVRHLDQRYEIAPFDTDAGSFPDAPERTNALTFREQVHAGYGTLQHTFGPIDAEVGVRVEHTRTKIDPMDESSESSRYTDLFPSASLTYEMGRGRRVSLSYSKRVDRPNAYQLSAFNASGDPYVRFVGNPNLEPEQIHKAELTVMQTVGPATITASPYARRKTNAIEWATVQNDSVTVRTYDNYDARTSYGAELTSSLKFGNVEAMLSGNVFRRHTRGGTLDEEATRDALAFMGRANVTWTLLETLRLQVSQMYRSPVTAGVGQIGSLMRSSASLETTFWNEKGTVGLEIEDPFDTSEIGLQKQTDDYNEHLTRNWDGRTVSISFSYRFGNSDRKNERRNSATGGGGLGMGGQ